MDKLGHCSPSRCTCTRRCAVWYGRSTEGCPYWSILQSRRLFWKTVASVKCLSLHKPIHCDCVGTRPAGRCPGSYCVKYKSSGPDPDSWYTGGYALSLHPHYHLVWTLPLTPFLLFHKHLPYIKAGCRMMQAARPQPAQLKLPFLPSSQACLTAYLIHLSPFPTAPPNGHRDTAPSAGHMTPGVTQKLPHSLVTANRPVSGMGMESKRWCQGNRSCNDSCRTRGPAGSVPDAVFDGWH